MLAELLLVALLPSGIFGFTKTVFIGGLFEKNTLLDRAFRSSITTLNEERHGNEDLPNQFVQPYFVGIVNNDSYDISRTVCELGNNGVTAIFGPQHEVVSRVVQSMCDSMEIPHVAARWDSEQIRGNGLINMYPYSHTLSSVYLELALEYKWKKFTIIYDTTESLIRMNKLLKRWDPNGYAVTIRQLPEGPDYRNILREVKASKNLNIVLDCSIDILHAVLVQAQQVGVMTDKHNYIIASLDLQTIDLEPFGYGGTNFTGLRLIDPEDSVVNDIFEEERFNWDLDHPTQLTVEAALVYDSVQLFGRALKHLDDTISTNVKKGLCDNRESWNHGSSLMNLMRLTEFSGLTGLIKFDSAGYRSDFKVDILTLNEKGLTKIGAWNTSRGVEFTPKEVSQKNLGEVSLRNRTFTVLIALTPPYGMLKESANMEIGNDRYEGFGVDIIIELSKKLGFNYTFEESDDSYGTKDPVTKEWNGMMKKIMEDRADLAICDLTITADRQEAVDFTMPFMNLGISILFTKPIPAGASLFSFLSPFSAELWVYLFAAYSFCAVVTFVVGRICPAEWTNPDPCVEEPEELENQFAVLTTVFCSNLGSIMLQGPELWPIGLSTRMMAGFWSFFCMIITSTYTANLAVFLLVESPDVLIKNAADLANNQHGIKYGAKKGGSTFDFFKASTDPIYQKMYKYMVENADEVLLASNDEGVAKVLQGNYAFFMESSSIAYEAERKCRLDKVGTLLDSKGYGIAMKKHSSYQNALSTAVLELQETGVLRELQDKWWTQKRGGGNCQVKKATSDSKPLGTENVGGVFLVLGVGVALACVRAVWELLWEVGCRSIKENVSFKEEMKEELKFLIKLNATTKPVRRRKSISASDDSREEDNEDISQPIVVTTNPKE